MHCLWRVHLFRIRRLHIEEPNADDGAIEIWESESAKDENENEEKENMSEDVFALAEL